MEGEQEEDAEFEVDFDVNYDIKIIEGMDSACAELLKNAGMKTTEDLLRMGATEPEHQHLAKKVEVTYAALDRCVCRGDLIRTRGVGKKYLARAHGTAFQHTTYLTSNQRDNLPTFYRDMAAKNPLMGETAILRCFWPKVPKEHWLSKLTKF